MNKLIFISLLLLGFIACSNNNSDNGVNLNKPIISETDSIAYTVGHSVGTNIGRQFPDIDPEILAAGIVAAFEGKENNLYSSTNAADNAIRAYIEQAEFRMNQENLERGQKFLEENAQKEGVQVTESGLQYIVIEQGSGEKPTAESTVKVHYTGTTIDGEVFDSSISRGEPTQFPLRGVISGWTEGIQLMPVGSKYKFFIPSELAYGPRRQGQFIAPNSALIFEVELIEIIK